MRRLGLILALAAALAACDAKLPDPESPGAQVMRARCRGCHRLYAPGSMTIEMWRLQLQRMRGLYAQRGLPWLTPAEEQTLLDYLARHAGTS